MTKSQSVPIMTHEYEREMDYLIKPMRETLERYGVIEWDQLDITQQHAFRFACANAEHYVMRKYGIFARIRYWWRKGL